MAGVRTPYISHEKNFVEIFKIIFPYFLLFPFFLSILSIFILFLLLYFLNGDPLFLLLAASFFFLPFSFFSSFFHVFLALTVPTLLLHFFTFFSPLFSLPSLSIPFAPSLLQILSFFSSSYIFLLLLFGPISFFCFVSS